MLLLLLLLLLFYFPIVFYPNFQWKILYFVPKNLFFPKVIQFEALESNPFSGPPRVTKFVYRRLFSTSKAASAVCVPTVFPWFIPTGKNALLRTPFYKCKYEAALYFHFMHFIHNKMHWRTRKYYFRGENTYVTPYENEIGKMLSIFQILMLDECDF